MRSKVFASLVLEIRSASGYSTPGLVTNDQVNRETQSPRQKEWAVSLAPSVGPSFFRARMGPYVLLTNSSRIGPRTLSAAFLDGFERDLVNTWRPAVTSRCYFSPSARLPAKSPFVLTSKVAAKNVALSSCRFAKRLA
jgi:hypothetical protein